MSMLEIALELKLMQLACSHFLSLFPAQLKFLFPFVCFVMLEFNFYAISG